MTQYAVNNIGCPAMEERREASLPTDDNESLPLADDKVVIVLSTEELTPLPEVSTLSVVEIVLVLTKTSDWLQLYEAVVTLRRVLVHHSEVITVKQFEEVLRPLALECDSLRSAPSKNGLLACAECFQFLPRSILERPLLSGAHPELLDVLLRRSVCEKRFLRDAAAIAVERIATHLSGLPLLAAAARYGTNKNGKLCGTAARVIALSLANLKQDQADGGRQILTHKSSDSLRAVYRALVAFRDSKEGTARAEATMSFQTLGEILGTEELARGLKDAMPGAGQAGVVARILKDAFPKTNSMKACPRMGSLRDRMRQDANARTGAVVKLDR